MSVHTREKFIEALRRLGPEGYGYEWRADWPCLGGNVGVRGKAPGKELERGVWPFDPVCPLEAVAYMKGIWDGQGGFSGAATSLSLPDALKWEILEAADGSYDSSGALRQPELRAQILEAVGLTGVK